MSGPAQDLHSGVFGRVVHEPMTDLAILMSKLVAPDGRILIKEVEDMVPPPDDEERYVSRPTEYASVFISIIILCRKIYEALDYTVKDLDEATGAHIGLSDDKAELLMGRMRYPSLSLHGIEGASSGPGFKTVIPAKVSCKFSIRYALFFAVQQPSYRLGSDSELLRAGS